MLRFSKIIAVVLVLLALALGVYAWMLSRQPAPAPTVATAASSDKAAEPTWPVVVATKPLPAGQPIAADAVRVAQLAVNPAGAFQSVAAVTGKVPVLSLGEGSPLLAGQMATGLALKLEAGERAVAVKADEVLGVGNNVRPGDYVDVFFTLKADGKDVDRSQTRLLMARKRVLAYGQDSLDALPPDESAADGASGGSLMAKPRNSNTNRRPAQARTVVLAVPVDDVNRLTLAEASGSLLLALRNPTDTSEPDPTLFAQLPPALQPLPPKPGTTRGPLTGIDRAVAGLARPDLVAGGAANVRRTAASPTGRVAGQPGAQRPARTEVEIIRGDRRDTVHY